MADSKTVITKAGNVLDELLVGLDPGMPGVPEKIWKAVSQRLGETECFVDLTFFKQWDDHQPSGRVTITYEYYPRQSHEALLQEVNKDCAALERLGFDELVIHSS